MLAFIDRPTKAAAVIAQPGPEVRQADGDVSRVSEGRARRQTRLLRGLRMPALAAGETVNQESPERASLPLG